MNHTWNGAQNTVYTGQLSPFDPAACLDMTDEEYREKEKHLVEKGIDPHALYAAEASAHMEAERCINNTNAYGPQFTGLHLRILALHLGSNSAGGVDAVAKAFEDAAANLRSKPWVSRVDRSA